jgi:class III poly(R)-hydroxyalkanoic acid synthase PhaE subunit
MSDKTSTLPEWIKTWIEQQRRALAAAAGPALSTEIRDLQRRWLDVGAAYLTGLAGLGGSTVSPDGFGAEVLAAWRRNWAGTDAATPPSGEWSELLARLPAMGLMREHADVWRELAAAQSECERLQEQLRAVFSRVQSEALTLLETRVQQRASAGRPVETPRELYDSWVECGEQVYAQVAHGEPFCRLQAELGNAAMRLRAHQQRIVEQWSKHLDLPTRSEVNTLHRTVSALRQELQATRASPAPASSRARGERRKPKGSKR